MKIFVWLSRLGLSALVAISFSCSDGGQPRDAAAGRDGVQPTPQPDAADAPADRSPNMADAQADLAPVIPDAPADRAPDVLDAPADGGGADISASDGASVDGSVDVKDGGEQVCWYDKARTGVALPSFGFSFVAPDQVTYTCTSDPRIDAGPPWPRDLRGVVTRVSATEFTLDTCLARDACDPGTYTFIVNAPGLELTMPVGRRVRVQWQITVSWSCTSWLQVSDDTSGAGGTVWLVGNRGFQTPPVDLPFDVNLDQLDCRLPADAFQTSCSGSRTGDFAFRFSSRSGPTSSLSLGTMESGRFAYQDAAGVAQTLDVHCLQAFQTVMCDDYWRWSYWAVNTTTASAPLDAAVDR